MPKKPIKIEIVGAGEERVLRKIYDDGTEERTPVVKTPRKKRNSARPYWYWKLGTGRRKFF
ncbi:MAG TPA: hypothetical protein VGH70_05735 [Bradyrhizobium sp.]|jgi:hypothetical protein